MFVSVSGCFLPSTDSINANDVSPLRFRICPCSLISLSGYSCSPAYLDALCPALIPSRPVFVGVSPPPLRTCPGASILVPGCSCFSAYMDAAHLELFSSYPVSAYSKLPLSLKDHMRSNTLQLTSSHSRAPSQAHIAPRNPPAIQHG